VASLSEHAMSDPEATDREMTDPEATDREMTDREMGASRLDIHRQEAGLSYQELWLRYFELGGMSTGLELESLLLGDLALTAHDHDVIAHAINERFGEMGGDHPVAYRAGHLMNRAF